MLRSSKYGGLEIGGTVININTTDLNLINYANLKTSIEHQLSNAQNT
ncbi:MAG: hypothetical protein AAF629_06950 [Chloroflexota bacterium]